MNQDPSTIIAEYINHHPLAVLSTVTPEGEPLGTVLYAGSDEFLNVYFLTKTGTGKVHNIEKHPNVALTFSGEDRQSTLQLSGTALRVTAHDENDRAFKVIASLKHDSQDFRLPIAKLDAGPYIVFRVDVAWARLTEYEHTNQIDGVVRVEYTR